MTAGGTAPAPADLLGEEVEIEAARPGVLVLACGAVAREVLAVIAANGWDHVTVRCLPAKLHSTPQLIPGAVDEKLAELAPRYERVFVAYADCGTGGALDPVLERHGVERLPGAHCYGFLAGNDAWEAIHEEDPATFYLTDFLARHFDALVIRGLRLDEHPELEPLVFGNYRRLVYLAQTDDPDLLARARAAAERLGLAFEHRRTGYGELVPALRRFVGAADERRTSPAPTGTCLPVLTVIWWRDIPAQVTAGSGRGATRAQLADRFQEAIDAAAMRAGLLGTDAYLAEWRRETRGCGDDLAGEVADEVAWLEAAYTDDVLERLVRANGKETG